MSTPADFISCKQYRIIATHFPVVLQFYIQWNSTHLHFRMKYIYKLEYFAPSDADHFFSNSLLIIQQLGMRFCSRIDFVIHQKLNQFPRELMQTFLQIVPVLSALFFHLPRSAFSSLSSPSKVCNPNANREVYFVCNFSWVLTSIDPPPLIPLPEAYRTKFVILRFTRP